VSNVVDATSEQAAIRELIEKGFRPIAVKPVGGKSSARVATTGTGQAKTGISLFQKKVKADELIMFTRQIMTLLRAGVPMLTALEALREQSTKTFGDVINKIYVDVMAGKSFSQALDQHPHVFSKLYVNSVKAGEMSGSLDVVLERLVALIKHDQETKKRVKSALQYPIFVVCAMIVAFIVVMTKVVPNFAKLFEGLHVALPLPTRILLGASKFMQNYILYILGVMGVGLVAFRWYIGTPSGRFWWDGLKQIHQVALGVEKGEGISGSMKKSELFPPMVNRMIAIGEQSGSLDNMLNSIATHYDTEVEYAIKNLTGMIEPILTIVIGAAVVVLALGIFLPMWGLIGAVK